MVQTTPTVLNVAEKPSVARALASVFNRMPGARDGGMRREAANQIFTHDNVCFPNVYAQGDGRPIHGPGMISDVPGILFCGLISRTADCLLSFLLIYTAVSNTPQNDHNFSSWTFGFL